MPIGNACQHPGAFSIDLSEDDILRAMKSIQGYIDITPGDFNEIYQRAFRHAIDRFSRLVTAEQIMTKSVIAVRPETPLIETARLNHNISELSRMLSDNHINRLPVADPKGGLLGIVSHGDIVNSFCAKL